MFESNSRNINFLNLVITIFSIMGIMYFNFNTINTFILLVSFYTLNILGNWLMLHRYFSHKSFEFKHNFLKLVFTFISIIAGRGSPIGWVYLHRLHHAHSDGEKDPHSPKNLGYKLFGFNHFSKIENEKMQIFMVKDMMTPLHLFIHKYYMLILLTFILCLGLISLELLYFMWILPALLVQLSQNNFNYFGHTMGYRNFETKDNSKNNIWLFPFVLGETWHNNHHHNPGNFSTKIRNYEIDPLGSFINLIAKKL